MAGSGMLKRVYDDRRFWERDRHFDLTLQLYDLHPKRPFIEERDARTPLSEEVDWIFLDPPYFGQSGHLYRGALARASVYSDYLRELRQVITAMSQSLRKGGRLCVLLPKWSGTNGDDLNHNIPVDAYAIAVETGLRWVDSASVSRGRQQESGGALMNERAKRIRRMRSDTCILNVFERPRN